MKEVYFQFFSSNGMLSKLQQMNLCVPIKDVSSPDDSVNAGIDH